MIPTSAIAIVASRNGAPTIAPIATLLAALLAAEHGDDRDQRLGHRRADRGQQAADRPLPEGEPVPAHSTALVNSRAPARMTAKLASRRT